MLSREPRRDQELGGGAGLSREPRRDQEEGGGAGLSREPRNNQEDVQLGSHSKVVLQQCCTFSDTIVVTLIRTAVEAATSNRT